jgi:hypothetical protein
MRISTVVSMFVGGFLMLGLATPAAAQVKVDFSGGYQYFRFLENGSEHVPTGWATSVGVGKDWVKFVGDVAGNYKDGEMLHTFQGGVEFSGKGKRVVPFARVLSGVAIASDSFESDWAFVLTPEGGVKLMANDRVGFQTSVGFPIFMRDGHTEGFRFFAGIVIRK